MTKSMNQDDFKKFMDMKKENIRLKSDLAKAVEGLEYYAEGNSHYSSKLEWDEGFAPTRGQDTRASGKRARQILAELKEQER